MVNQKQVCIIGAGVSGLAAAKAFLARGHHVTVVERSGDLGGVWEPARSYPDVQTQSPKDLYRYTDRGMPTSYPEWPTGPQVHAYLADYARDYGIKRLIRFNTAVLQMNRRPDSIPGWKLDLRGTDSHTTQEDFDFVVICTGPIQRAADHKPPRQGHFRDSGRADSALVPIQRCRHRQGAQGRRARWLEISHRHRRQCRQFRC